MTTRPLKFDSPLMATTSPVRSLEHVESRTAIIAALNSVVAEMIDASLAARHAHWNVRGSDFNSLHELFGQIHAELERHIDVLGERIATLGGIPRGTAQGVVSASRLPPYPLVKTAQDEHLDAMTGRLAQVAVSMRSALSECEHVEDPVSAHHVTDAWATIDKLGWLLSSHLAKVH